MPVASFGRGPERTAGAVRISLVASCAVPGAQTLVCAVVLGIDRNQFRAARLHRIHHQLAAGNQHLFIRQADAFAARTAS